ncbi:bifunctional metallophosphatase/5'-nucleotidase [Bacillus songklensis]|uniref:Bifunctional metallophosphatase/5'-nucleotidase n=1 Tax=Bacillus songklensis TaxID=1069116 RepID=A0ABV8B6M7_9BACI
MKMTIPALALSVTFSAGSAFASGQPQSPGIPASTDSYQHRYIDVQLLGINDLHGQLDVTRKVGGKEVGRADYLAAYLKQRESENMNTLLVHAGDAVGASSPVSALLQDEPTIEFLNKMGFDVGTVGNHEFDEGVHEMMRLIYGGTHPKTGDFAGADFPYVAANVIDKETGKPILPPYVIKKVNGMPIGFIGVALSDTPSIVIPSGVAGVEFTDETEAINKAAAELKQQGVEAIVVLAHNPGNSKPDGSNANGEIVEIAKNVDDEVDVMFGGHNHAYLNTEVDGKLLVQSYSYGTAFSDVDLQIDPHTKDIVSKKAEIVTTFHDGIEPDAEIKEMVEKYEAKVAPIVNQVLGTAETTLTAGQNAAGESALGNLIADAQRKAMNTDFAFMNPGGIRADIEQGEVTWGDLYTVQPFNNDLVKMTLTGQQVRDLLNQQWQPAQTRMLQISGLKYTWDPAKAIGEKVGDITLPNGTPIDPEAEYTVTANSFLAGGGDGFSVFNKGENREVGPVDLDALVDYVKQLPQPFTAQIEGRIIQ